MKWEYMTREQELYRTVKWLYEYIHVTQHSIENDKLADCKYATCNHVRPILLKHKELDVGELERV